VVGEGEAVRGLLRIERRSGSSSAGANVFRIVSVVEGKEGGESEGTYLDSLNGDIIARSDKPDQCHRGFVCPNCSHCH